jgi:hypothetical protein
MIETKPILFEPFSTILEAFQGLYPEAAVPVVRVQPTRHLGAVVHPGDGSDPWIELSPDLPLVGACDILCHELAHLAASTGWEDQVSAHGPEWQAAYAAIVAEYERLMETRKVAWVECAIPGAENSCELDEHGRPSPGEELAVRVVETESGGAMIACENCSIELLCQEPPMLKVAIDGSEVSPVAMLAIMEVVQEMLGMSLEEMLRK